MSKLEKGPYQVYFELHFKNCDHGILFQKILLRKTLQNEFLTSQPGGDLHGTDFKRRVRIKHMNSPSFGGLFCPASLQLANTPAAQIPGSLPKDAFLSPTFFPSLLLGPSY